MKHTVITGGAGFIGSHLCDALLQKGHRVTCVDNLSTGSRENISHLERNERFTFLEHDVTESFAPEGNVDNILHFASPASPPDFEPLALEVLRANSIGTLNCLEIARTHDATFLLASTSEVYGDPTRHPQSEDYRGNVNVIGPRAPYDESKRFAETATMVYHRKYGLRTHIARIFNTYGPRMQLDDGRVLPNFLGQALRGEDITVFGDGTQTRSFCYVDDLVTGILLLLESDVSEPVNLGNPDELTVEQFAREILELTGSSSRIVYRPLPEDDPKRRRPDITRAERLLGWRPEVSRAEGLKRTLEYFRKWKTSSQ